ncbi:UNVERIFIED_CONTAM: hypothetical protein Sangu_2474300 [Sesamum angustifolium]|uniref:Uncharacterized protein n=1 Tax=Sesamum angustifolium TaxID=2727405 RepID=A0AAW2IQ11_9LAMI
MLGFMAEYYNWTSHGKEDYFKAPSVPQVSEEPTQLGMLRKDDVDLEYCKFCGNARYKPARGRDPHRKKSTYAVLRYLPLNPHLQRLYSSRTTVQHMTWHATHQTKEGSSVIPPMSRRGSILTGILILQKSRIMFGWAFA